MTRIRSPIYSMIAFALMFAFSIFVNAEPLTSTRAQSNEATKATQTAIVASTDAAVVTAEMPQLATLNRLSAVRSVTASNTNYIVSTCDAEQKRSLSNDVSFPLDL